ncbi:MAG: 50S ribosomal protein L17 [Halobacteriovoraceae bacterium]|nr:50S ribosomal protein L17 [Halobacteriovoraceae bacterium]
MRHKSHRYKVGTTPAHRKALMVNLASEIIDHGKVKTSYAKCKAVQPYVEKLISLARLDSVANRRKAASRLGNKRTIVSKLFNEVAPHYIKQPGGYTRVVHLPDGRVGDNASMGIIALVEKQAPKKTPSSS